MFGPGPGRKARCHYRGDFLATKLAESSSRPERFQNKAQESEKSASISLSFLCLLCLCSFKGKCLQSGILRFDRVAGDDTNWKGFPLSSEHPSGPPSATNW